MSESVAKDLLREWMVSSDNARERYSLMIRTANYLQGKGAVPPIPERPFGREWLSADHIDMDRCLRDYGGGEYRTRA